MTLTLQPLELRKGSTHLLLLDFSCEMKKLFSPRFRGANEYASFYEIPKGEFGLRAYAVSTDDRARTLRLCKMIETFARSFGGGYRMTLFNVVTGRDQLWDSHEEELKMIEEIDQQFYLGIRFHDDWIMPRDEEVML